MLERVVYMYILLYIGVVLSFLRVYIPKASILLNSPHELKIALAFRDFFLVWFQRMWYHGSLAVWVALGVVGFCIN